MFRISTIVRSTRIRISYAVSNTVSGLKVRMVRFLLTDPKAAREFESIVRDHVDTAIEDADLVKQVEEAVEQSIENVDLNDKIETAVKDALDEQLESAIEDAVEKEVEDAVGNYDFSDDARNALEEAAGQFNFEDAITEALGDETLRNKIVAHMLHAAADALTAESHIAGN